MIDMKWLILKVSKVDETHFDETNECPVFSIEHYCSFFLKSGIVEKLQPEISIRCGVCKSFVVSAAALYDLLSGPDSPFYSADMEGWVDAFNETGHSLLTSLTEEITASDEEWESYFAKGTPQLNPLHLGPKGVHIPEWANNPVRLKSMMMSFFYLENANPATDSLGHLCLASSNLPALNFAAIIKRGIKTWQ